MLERTDAITKEVLEPITFVLACPTVFLTHQTGTDIKMCKLSEMLSKNLRPSRNQSLRQRCYSGCHQSDT